MGDVMLGSGVEVIHTDDVTSGIEKMLTEKRTQESGAAGHQNTFLKMHRIVLSSMAFN